jgi:hypothetical protein
MGDVSSPNFSYMPTQTLIPTSLAYAILLLTKTYRMSHRRGELAEMTALYLVPIVSVVIVASAGGLVANVLPDPQDRLRTLIICFVFWGIATPLSWMVTTLYFLRLTVHEPLSREVIVSSLLPVGPLSLSAFW